MAKYIDSTLKPLYVSLKKLNLGKYLVTKDYEFLCTHMDIDDEWNNCFKEVMKTKTMYVMGEEMFEEHEKAFLFFMSEWTGVGFGTFSKLLLPILLNFAKWSKVKLDFAEVIENLKKLDVDRSKILNFTTDLRKTQNTKGTIVEDINKPSMNYSNSIRNNNVFIVHGHNNEMKEKVSSTISKLGLTPIILHEKPNGGKTIIEKFESNAEVGFAIVLLTDDDIGCSVRDKIERKRARQNVIFELGYFFGKLGRSRVITLYSEGVELPSDMHGLVYVQIDNANSWKLELVKELKEAGYSVDANKII